MPKSANPIPKSIPSITAITIQITMATTAIMSAFNHPVSKKCFTKASQMNSTIMPARMPEKRYWINPPITVPRITIQSASVNFALSVPAKSLPEIQRTGAKITMLTIICIIRFTIAESKLITHLHFLRVLLYSHIIPFKSFLYLKNEETSAESWHRFTA